MKAYIVVILLLLAITATASAELSSRRTVDRDGNSVLEISGSTPQRSGSRETEPIEEKKPLILEKEERRLPEKDVKIHSATIREIDATDSFVKSSFKLDVYNDGPAGNISIELQGVDKDGYEILNRSLSSDFMEFQQKTITDISTFWRSEYSRIRQWNVKKVSKTLR